MRISQVARHGILLHASVTTMDVDGHLGCSLRGLGGVILRHGELVTGSLALVLDGGSSIPQQSSGFEVDLHVRQFKLDRLQLADWLAIKDALIGEFHGGFQTGGMQTQRAPHHAAPTGVTDGCHGYAHPLSLVAEQVFSRHHTILEFDLTRVTAAHAHFMFLVGGSEALYPRFYDEGRKRFGIPFVDRHHDLRVGGVRIGDEALAPINDVRSIVLLIAGSASLRIGTTTWLGDRHRGEALAIRQTRQVFCFLFIIAEMDDRGDSQPTHLHHHRCGHGNARDLLQGDQSFHVAQSESAVLLRYGDGHHLALTQSFHGLIPPFVGLLHHRNERCDPGLGEFTRGFAKQLLLFSECEIDHFVPSTEILSSSDFNSIIQ